MKWTNEKQKKGGLVFQPAALNARSCSKAGEERTEEHRYVQGRCPFHSNDKRRPGTEEDSAEPSKSVRCLKGKGQKRKAWGCSSEERAPAERMKGKAAKVKGLPRPFPAETPSLHG